MVGDGSYLRLNSEIAPWVAMGLKLPIVVLDNRGFGCINRLQQSLGGEPFNNLLAGGAASRFAPHSARPGPTTDRAAHTTAPRAAPAPPPPPPPPPHPRTAPPPHTTPP